MAAKKPASGGKVEKKPASRAQKVGFTMKRAKQRYRSAHHDMGEDAPKMPPLKKWIKENAKQVGELSMSKKLEKLVLQ